MSFRLVIAFAVVAAAGSSQPAAADISSIVIEAQTGLVISEQSADKRRPPASMVKLMQLLMVSEGLDAGKWTLDTPIKVSANAAGITGTGVSLRENEEFPLEKMAQAVAVRSANDGAMAVAEALWGDERSYLKAANKRARELGMNNTEFNSPHGLPPGPGGDFDMTTARDMVRLAQFCVLDPRILAWTSQRELQFRPTDPVMRNTNRLLESMDECDGLKTGFINRAGFCLTATAVRDGVRLISVVMGTSSNAQRFAQSETMLDDAFGQITRKHVVAKGAAIGDPVPVANSQTPAISLTAADDLWVIVKRDDADRLEVASTFPALIQAPVSAGAAVGEINVELAGKVLGTVALTAPVSLQEADLRWKLLNSLAMPRR